MEEGLDIDKIMYELGFVKERDSIGEGYTKEIRLCNSNCIGCEYCIFFGIRKARGEMYHCYGVLYKPLSTDAEMRIDDHGTKTDEPWSRLFILNTERGSIDSAVYDCAYTMAKVMTAMDFRQISGTDFIDLSNSSRGNILRDFENQFHTNVHCKFNPTSIPNCRG